MTQPPRTEGDVLKDLNLTKDELGKFEKAFKDPKFLELFSEYAKEVSDPKAREENDLYLRQLESQGKAEEVYGKGVQLIVPQVGFVLKTRAKESGKKLFINVCTSEKMDPHKLEDAKGPDGRAGRMMHVPFTLGQLKDGSDKKGENCSIVDFVVNPDTKEFAAKNPNVMQLLADTAMDAIEKRDSIKLDRRFSLPKIKYKATEACPQPHVLSIRADGDSNPGGRLQPKPGYDGSGFLDQPIGSDSAATSSAATSSAATSSAATSSAAASSAVVDGKDAHAASPAAAAEGAGAARGGGRSSFAFPATAPKSDKPSPPKGPLEAGFRHPSGEETPSHDLIHRGVQDMAAAWGDAGRGLLVDVATPKELVVRVKLPGVTSAAAAELDIGLRSLSLRVPGKYLLDLPLPHKVDEASGRAKYDKAKQTLEVVLPVVPPPAPPAGALRRTALVSEAKNPATEDVRQEAGESSRPSAAEPGEVTRTTDLNGKGDRFSEMSSVSPSSNLEDRLKQGCNLNPSGPATGEAKETPAVVADLPNSANEVEVGPPFDASPSSSSTGSVLSSSGPADVGDLTENERKWQAIHEGSKGSLRKKEEGLNDSAEASAVSAVSSGPSSSASASVSASSAVEAAGSTSSTETGSNALERVVEKDKVEDAAKAKQNEKDGEKPTTASTAAAAAAAAAKPLSYKPTYLKPRLNRALAEDL